MQDISHFTTYDNFAKKWGEDSRFEALERKDRESLLNERFVEVFSSYECGIFFKSGRLILTVHPRKLSLSRGPLPFYVLALSGVLRLLVLKWSQYLDIQIRISDIDLMRCPPRVVVRSTVIT